MPERDIVFVAAEPWAHYTWRRRHYVARELAKKNRVLWIAPPIPSLGLIFRKHYGMKNYNRESIFDMGRLKHPEPNLWVYCPVQILPTWHRIPAIYRLNERFVKFSLRRVTRRLGISNPILWLYLNRCEYEYFGLFDEEMIVYDKYDKTMNYANGGYPNGEIPSIFRWEVNAVRRANVAFAASQILRDDISTLNNNCHVIPHGVEYDAFHGAGAQTMRKPLPLVDIPKPLICFLGIMHDVVDFSLLDYVAESHPEWSILLLGRDWINTAHIRSRFHGLIKRHNVFYLGEISKSDIPAYLHCIDVCLMPFKKTEHVIASSPLKVWEYLAAGKPVVASDRGVEYDCHSLIKVASEPQGFVRCIEEALREDSPELIARRKEVAQTNTWDKRVDEMMKLVQQQLAPC